MKHVNDFTDNWQTYTCSDQKILVLKIPMKLNSVYAYNFTNVIQFMQRSV